MNDIHINNNNNSYKAYYVLHTIPKTSDVVTYLKYVTINTIFIS